MKLRDITINYTYYNNKELFLTVQDWYRPFKDKFNFVVIDDGSQDEPISRTFVEDWWKILRIEEDYGWGNEVARNLLMKNSPTEWNCLMDLDIVIDLQDKLTHQWMTKDFLKYYGQTYGASVCFQFELGARTNYDDLDENPDYKNQGLNSFMVSRTTFMQTYGYDMSLAWLYGSDFTFFSQLSKELIIPNAKLKKLAVQASPSEKRYAPGDTEAYNEVLRLTREWASKGWFSMSGGVWINHDMHQKHCKEFPETVEL